MTMRSYFIAYKQPLGIIFVNNNIILKLRNKRAFFRPNVSQWGCDLRCVHVATTALCRCRAVLNLASMSEERATVAHGFQTAAETRRSSAVPFVVPFVLERRFFTSPSTLARLPSPLHALPPRYRATIYT